MHIALTGVHGAEHAGDEFVNAVAFLHQWRQRGDSTFIVVGASEMRKDELLELVDLILQRHQIRDGLVTFVGVVDRFQTDILFVLEGAFPMSAWSLVFKVFATADPPLNSGCWRWKASLAWR